MSETHTLYIHTKFNPSFGGHVSERNTRSRAAVLLPSSLSLMFVHLLNSCGKSANHIHPVRVYMFLQLEASLFPLLELFHLLYIYSCMSVIKLISHFTHCNHRLPLALSVSFFSVPSLLCRPTLCCGRFICLENVFFSAFATFFFIQIASMSLSSLYAMQQFESE